MHFKLDENVPVGIQSLLRGHKCSTVFSQKISGISDSELIRHCKAKKCVLVTLDGDFADTVNYPASRHNGIIILKPTRQGVREVRSLFSWFLANFDLKKSAKSTILVDGTSIRERK